MSDKAKRAWIAIVAAASLAWSLWVLALTVLTLMQKGSIHLTGSLEWFRFVLRRFMAVVMIWLSIRGFRLAAGIDALEEPRIKVWRIFAGAVMLVSSLTLTFVPNARKYQADNVSQLLGMSIGWILCMWLAAWLIRSAFPRKPQEKGVEETA